MVISDKPNKTARSRHHPTFFLPLWTTISGLESLPRSDPPPRPLDRTAATARCLAVPREVGEGGPLTRDLPGLFCREVEVVDAQRGGFRGRHACRAAKARPNDTGPPSPGCVKGLAIPASLKYSLRRPTRPVANPHEASEAANGASAVPTHAASSASVSLSRPSPTPAPRR